MTAKELKKRYLDFFGAKGHKILPNVSLIPENDPTALFISAGMHPLVPYLLGEPHLLGRRLVNVQRCLRTDDIDEVGDAFHHTFFEMLGNWSLGDYFKKETITWSYEFLTQELNLDPNRMYITCFQGDENVPKDTQSAQVWQFLGIPKERVYFFGKKENFWGPIGETGPCGPDTEMHYDVTKIPCGPNCQPNDNCSRFSEIWNDVFMEYNRTTDGRYEKLPCPNVDTGMGLERVLAVVNNLDDDYRTEVFWPIIQKIEEISNKKYGENLVGFRIIADHLRAATFILAEEITPSNVGQGYVLRRLIRRAIRYGKQLGIGQTSTPTIAEVVIHLMEDVYPEPTKNEQFIKDHLISEEEKFKKTIEDGLKRAQKIFNKKVPINPEKYSKIMQTADKKEIFREIYKGEPGAILKFSTPIEASEIQNATISGKEAFDLYQTFGFPIEMIIELAQGKNLLVDVESYKEELKKHQELSRAASVGMFKGGLVDHSEQTVRGHTATHLLHQALRDVLGPNVYQTGSNITPERLRFDFSQPEKLTLGQIQAVENLVNEQIRKNLAVEMEIMDLKTAIRKGALTVPGERYPQQVKVYSIASFSKEVCGGPHIDFTGSLGKFKIIKEEAAGAGVRRLYAKLEKKS